MENTLEKSCQQGIFAWLDFVSPAFLLFRMESMGTNESVGPDGP